MDIKLIAFDLDGTVLPMMTTEIQQSFLQTAAQVAATGVDFAIFTGRSVTTIPAAAQELPFVRYISYANGAGVLVKQTGQRLYSSQMSRELALRVLEAISHYDVVPQVFTEGRVIYPSFVLEHPENYRIPAHHLEAVRRGLAEQRDDLVEYLLQENPLVDKLNILHVDSDTRAALVAELKDVPGLDIVSSGGSNLEFNSSTTNKGLALQGLADYLGLSMSQVMALGDNDNDVGMLRAAGIGVALGDGSPAARAAADYITAPLTEEGATAALLHFFPQTVTV